MTNNKINRSQFGQTAPPDMMLVPGVDGLDSFYIGIIEEPNINYIMYLKHLAATYLSYPYVF